MPITIHPNLLLNRAEIEEIKLKVNRYAWARQAYASLKANTDEWAARTISVPDTGGGFYHAADPAEHLITVEHYALSEAARDMGLMYQFTNETRYRDQVKTILLAYADKYLTYEYHDKAKRTGDEAFAGGRATSQGINEATWVIPLAWVYDLIYNDLTPEEQERIKTKLLRPAAEIIMDNNEGRHNHQTWYNAGVGVIGFVLNDKELIWYALEKPDSGHYFQMETSITADGMWYEGSMHYQFYVLNALLPFMEAAHHAGIGVYQNPAYKGLFDFMLDFADASMKLPTFNDGRVVCLTEPDRACFYELALRRFGDARYAPVLHASDRTDLLALLYGVGELPSVDMPVWRSRHFAGSNLAVLRAGKGDDAMQAVLNIMGYQGGHSHADQLGLVFSGLNQTLIPDSGSIRYRVPSHVEYFKQSVAHNVLVVNGRSQEPCPPPTLHAFVGSPSLQVAMASTSEAYPSVRLSRTLLLTDDYLIDIFETESEVKHTYDWVLRSLGTLSTDCLDPRPVSTPSATGNGYEYLENVRIAGPVEAGRQTFEWQVDPNRHVRLDQFSKAGDQYFFADSLIATDKNDEIADTTVPVLFARRVAASTQYLSIIQPHSGASAIDDINEVTVLGTDGQALKADEAFGLQIKRNGRTDLLMLARNDGPKQFGDMSIDGRLAWTSHEGDVLQALYLAQGTTVECNGWALRLEGMTSVPDLENMGVHLEVVGPNRVSLHNSSARSAVTELDGWLSGEIEVFELDWEGRPTTAVQSSRSEDSNVRFIMEPQKAYELVGQD